MERERNVSDRAQVMKLVLVIKRLTSHHQVVLVLYVLQVVIVTRKLQTVMKVILSASCGCREPPVKDSIVFWVDCDSCGEWAHTHCALRCNSATRNFVCLSCTQKCEASSFVVIINVIFWCFFTVGDIRRKPRIIATLD